VFAAASLAQRFVNSGGFWSDGMAWTFQAT
jgi:hypothetical protein